jgi:hypothetical protein
MPHNAIGIRWDVIPRFLATRACVILAGLLAVSRTDALEVWAYSAGSGASVPVPVSVGWAGQNLAPSAGNLSFPVEDDLSLGLNAWQLADQSRNLANPVFTGNLSIAHAQEAASNGWRLTLTSRYVFDFGDGPNLGVSVVVGGKDFTVLFDLSSTGDLVATPRGSSPLTLTTGGDGPTAYNDFAITYYPGTGTSELRFNNVAVGVWGGVSTVALDSVAWGSFGGDQRGVMNFHRVAFEVLGPPSVTPGDYNTDDRVDGLDYQQWRTDFGRALTPLGSRSDGNSDGRIDAADYTIWRDHFGTGVAGLLGDYNSDGSVDAGDYTVWRDTVGAAGSSPSADGDGDGDVDAFDYSVWRTRYGSGAASGSSRTRAVPEVSTLWLTLGTFLTTPLLKSRSGTRQLAKADRKKYGL